MSELQINECPWCHCGIKSNSSTFVFWACGSSVGHAIGDPLQTDCCRIRELDQRLAASRAECERLNTEIALLHKTYKEQLETQNANLQLAERQIQTLGANLKIAVEQAAYECVADEWQERFLTSRNECERLREIIRGHRRELWRWRDEFDAAGEYGTPQDREMLAEIELRKAAGREGET